MQSLSAVRFCLVGLVYAGLVTACIPAEVSPLPPAPETFADQVARGAPLYAQNCATSTCHGAQGEGVRSGDTYSAWPLVGPEFEARNPNAQVVFDVVRSGSEQNLRAMTDQQIYDAIAYELSQNGVSLDGPLTAHNALSVATGASRSPATSGGLYPPPANVRLVGPPFTLIDWGGGGSGGYLTWRVDQLATADRIGSRTPPEGGLYLLLVVAFANENDRPLDVGPEFLRLSDSQGNVHEPQTLDLNYPIERFHQQTIEPEHGTAAVVIFTLPAGAVLQQLTYDDGTGHAMILALTR